MRPAGGLFLDAGGTGTAREFLEHLFRALAIVRQHDQAMKPEVGRLGDDPFGRTILRRHHCLRGFLADLFQDRVFAARQQPGNIGRLGIATTTLFDDCCELGQYGVVHLR